MRFFKNTTINFIGLRKVGFTISGLLLIASISSLIIQGGPRYGIDFRGGTFLELRFEDTANPDQGVSVPITDVRSVFATMGFERAEIKYFGSTQQDIAVQLDIEQHSDSLMTEVIREVDAQFPQYTIIERRRETVGPKIGGELVRGAINSILFAMLLILIYIMIRFELRFGVGAVVALFHDVLITLGLFSILQLEITIPVVAAILTIVGYSLNDTIVVFDRIRENLKRRYTNYAEVVNISINQTLSRTVITSGTTLLVVIILYSFGGEILKDFSFALICGVIVGTYSSQFIASPVLVEWELRRGSRGSTNSKVIKGRSGKRAPVAESTKK